MIPWDMNEWEYPVIYNIAKNINIGVSEIGYTYNGIHDLKYMFS